MDHAVQPPSSVLLLVGREDFTPPASFGGRAFVATTDCVAIAVRGDGPTRVGLGPVMESERLVPLADVEIETEGLVSLRDIYSREVETMGVTAGRARVVLWVDDVDEPGEVLIGVAASAEAR